MMIQAASPRGPAMRCIHPGRRGTGRPPGRPARAGRLALAPLLLLGLAAGCGGGSSSPSAASAAETGTVRLVPPGGCAGSPCVGTTLNGVEISGPESFAAFTMTFGVTSVLPTVPPGSYVVSDISFTDSANGTTGCPAAGFTVASGKATTVTFAITNDVCTITVSGPA